MILQDPLNGKHISIRTAREGDAEFILKLRLNPELNRFLNKTDSSIKKQKEWIRQKQLADDDYHMIIEDQRSGKRVGTVAIYNINYRKKVFEWGRWVISKKAPLVTALESAKLIYDFAFKKIGLKKAVFGVQEKNETVIDFHKGYGAKAVRREGSAIWFEFLKRDLPKFMLVYKKILHR